MFDDPFPRYSYLRAEAPVSRARYREMRTKTSHTYNEETALDVVAGIPAFLDEARHLCRELQARAAP